MLLGSMLVLGSVQKLVLFNLVLCFGQNTTALQLTRTAIPDACRPFFAHGRRLRS